MNDAIFNRNWKLGILGGGQLGQMLIQSGISFNIDFHVLDPSEKAPCSTICSNFVKGDFNDYETVMCFGRDLDQLTIEIEHVNVRALQELERMGKIVTPSPDVLRLIQDKGLQKQHFQENDLPTAPFHLIETRAEIAEFLDFLPAAQKLRKGGYDGKGVSLIDQSNYVDQSFDAPCVLEKTVAIEKELAFVVARSLTGEVKCFPPVEMVFNPKLNLVDYLLSPADISIELASAGEEMACRLAESLDIVGLLAVEVFLNEDGELLINELAPRPHNSGHHSIEGNYTSQFEQHLRAICGMPLGSVDLIQPAAMINLLGSQGHQGAARYKGMESLLKEDGVYPHLYGKAETRPGRKMGHVTVLADSTEELKKKIDRIKQHISVEA